MYKKIIFLSGIIFLAIINCKSIRIKESIDPVNNLSKKYYFINYIDFKHLMMTSTGHRITIRARFNNSEYNILLKVDTVIKEKNMILLSVKEDRFFYFHKNKDTIRYNSDLSEYYFRNMIFRHYSDKTKLPSGLKLEDYFSRRIRLMKSVP